MDSCVFCQIAEGDIKAKLTYEDEQVVAFHDLEPQAPVHQLIIPREHLASLNHITEQHHALLGHMLSVAQELASQHQIAEAGYRVVTNCNAAAGQSVFHLHFHLLGGRAMEWPPG